MMSPSPGNCALAEEEADTVTTAAHPQGLQVVDPLAEEQWDARLTSHLGASFFLSAAWAAVLAHTYGYTPCYLAVKDASGISALLPLCEVDSFVTGRRGVSLPFTDECHALCGQGWSFEKLFCAALEHGSARGWRYLECRGGAEALPGAVPSLTFIAHGLELCGDEDRLWRRFDSSVRRAIRSGTEAGLRVDIARDEGAVEAFCALHARTRRKHGLPPQPRAFFANIHRLILSKGLGFVALARRDQQPVAAAMFFHLGMRAIFKFGASDESLQHLRGNNVVMWEAMRWLARNGFERLDLGRTAPANEGLRRYKCGWGAEENPLTYVKYDLRKGGFTTDRDRTSGWHTGLFRRLPLPLCRLAGALLYRHLG
jgi:hypothetical protein